MARLWTGAGALLATASFTGETASGWQQVTLASPVPVAANTTYVASYHTASGRYSVDEGYFAASVSNGPLTFLANGTDGGNGVYAYGAGGFPNQTFNASNYWVDVVFTTSGGGADTTPPLVAAVSPASGAVGVNAGTAVTATFNEGIYAATLTTSTFLLRDASNSVVPATVSYSTSAVRATLTPTKASARAKVTRRIHPDVVGMVHGFGHWGLGPVARGKGTNDSQFVPGKAERISGMAAQKDGAVRIYK